MPLELFPFVILNNPMAFVYAYFFSDFLCFEMSLLLLTVTLRGVSNKHCLLYFSLAFIQTCIHSSDSLLVLGSCSKLMR